MWLPIIGLVTGLLIGSVFTFAIPAIYAKYLSIAVLAALDCLIGGWCALMRGEFDSAVLISGFFVNTLLAAGLALLGDFLGIDLYLAAVVAFGLRIFSNMGIIRRYLIDYFRNKRGVLFAAVSDVFSGVSPSPSENDHNN